MEGLRAIVALRRELAELELRHVAVALGEGRSWSQIAEALGISKQAAHKRHARRVRAAPEQPRTTSQRRLLVTGQARRVVERAREEAHATGEAEIGPEHLLLGLLRDDHGTALRALEAAGVELEAARAALPGGEGAKTVAGEAAAGRVKVSPQARATLEESLREAVRLGDSHLGVEHLLLALLSDPRAPAGRLLAELGVHPADVALRVHQLVGGPG
jgi:ATP-dependent Clp protease ATP-binding subunit ClpA